jgi:cytochrome P450
MSTAPLSEPISLAGRMPGPRPRFPNQIALAFRMDTLGFLTRVARQYGDFVYFMAGGHPFYILSHPDAVRDVLVTKDDCFIKGPALQRAKETLGDGLLTSEGEFHRRQRRLSQPSFHPQRVAHYGQAMAGIADRAAATWRQGERVDIHEKMMAITLQIVAKTLFDADVEQDVDAIGGAVDISVKMFMRAMTPWGPILNRLPLPSNYRFRRARKRLFDTLDRFVAEHRRQNRDRGDLLSTLLKAHDAEQQESPADDHAARDLRLRQELYTIFTAGHETTANALAFTLYLLAKNRSAETELLAELQRVVGNRLPGVEDVENLSYARMVLSEAMRLYPPAWALGRQATCEVEIAGHLLPKDAVVLNSQWVVHRDPRWYPQPHVFDPLRWTPEARSQRQRWSYFPFGGGSRQCIGESFAWMEAILVLATILPKWKMQLIDDRPLALRPTITLRPRHGIPVVLTKR